MDQDNVVVFTTSVASEAGFVIVAFTILAVRVVRRALEGDVVSVAICVDLVSDEFSRGGRWKQATYSISPSCPLEPVTTMRHQSVLVLLLYRV